MGSDVGVLLAHWHDDPSALCNAGSAVCWHFNQQEAPRLCRRKGAQNRGSQGDSGLLQQQMTVGVALHFVAAVDTVCCI